MVEWVVVATKSLATVHAAEAHAAEIDGKLATGTFGVESIDESHGWFRTGRRNGTAIPAERPGPCQCL
jgi:hypothetical protein